MSGKPAYAIPFICFGVSSHASVAHRPKRNEATSSLARPPFFNPMPAVAPPEINRPISSLKQGSWPTSKTFSGAGFSSISCGINAFGSPPGVSSSEKARRFFNPSDWATISAVWRAQKWAGKDQVETQVQILHGAGNLPELTFAFGREGPLGIRFEPRRAAFHRNSMPQNIQVHRGRIPLRAPGAIPSNVTFFHLGWDEVAS